MISKEVKPIHHQVNVVRIEQVLPHPNADKLEIIPVEGYQAISAKGQFKVGDLGYYIQPDSVVPERDEYAFVWGNKIIEGGVPEKRRRIAAKKLRGEWSEGLLMPLPTSPRASNLASLPPHGHTEAIVGQDISDELGIYHYNPPEPGEPAQALPKAKRPRSLRGLFYAALAWIKGERREVGVQLDLPTYDVQAFKKVRSPFEPGEWVLVTEKIHGANARFVFKKGVFGEGVMYAGSRNLWLSPKSNDTWHQALKDNPFIEQWCRAHPNYALYGEIVPVQKDGKGQYFNYGVPIVSYVPKHVRFFWFDIRKPDGTWAELDEYLPLMDMEEGWSEISTDLFGARVPVLYVGNYNEAAIKSMVDGTTTVAGSTHIREGIVIRAVPERNIRGIGRAQLKIVSNSYLEKS